MVGPRGKYRPVPQPETGIVLRQYLLDRLVADGYDHDDALTLLRPRVIAHPGWPTVEHRTRDQWAAWAQTHNPLHGL